MLFIFPIRSLIQTTVLVFFLSFFAGTAVAAGQGYRNSAWSLQSSGRQASIGGELNLAGRASLTVEGSYTRKGEDLRDDEQEKSPGDSLESQGREVALIFSRYTDGANMSGLYWSLGPGYRTVSAQWHRHPFEGEDPGTYRLTSSGDTDQSFDIKGFTTHGRVGFRYIFETVPVVVGILVGIRHYQAIVSDDGAATEGDNKYRSSDDARKSLQHRYMSSISPGITFGLAL